MGAGRSEICITGQQAGNSWAGSDSIVLRPNFFFLRETLVLLLKPFTDWMRSTHIIEVNFLKLESTDCRC